MWKIDQPSKPVISKLTIRKATAAFTVTWTLSFSSILIVVLTKFDALKVTLTISSLQSEKSEIHPLPVRLPTYHKAYSIFKEHKEG
jgi:hypothetical protein